MPYETMEDLHARCELDADGCLLWQGGKHPQGYGMIRWNNEKMRTCHSIVAELKYGYYPRRGSSHKVTHTCNKPHCLNPDHIEIRSASFICKNIAIRSGRIRTLSNDDIRYIREEYARGEWGMGHRLAEKFNRSPQTIYGIVKGRIYAELYDDE